MLDEPETLSENGAHGLMPLGAPLWAKTVAVSERRKTHPSKRRFIGLARRVTR